MTAARAGAKSRRPEAGVWPFVRGSTRVVGIIGDPVEHSLSPLMHNAAFAALGLDWVYVPFPVRAGALPAAVRGLAALGVVGANVTVPHKEAVGRYVDELSPLAKRVGAVNTIVCRSGRLYGDNTDVYGVRQALRRVKLRGATAVVVGAGGAARAVLVALEALGVRRVLLVNRTLERARVLRRKFSSGGFHVEVRDFSALVEARYLKEVRLVVNTTSLGLHGEPFPAVAFELTPRECVAFDLIYGRWTDFLRRARAADRKTIDGSEMLLHQGAEAFRLWTGRRAPLEVMRSALAGVETAR
ncbi:MAG: shikimate dehydrogenase [Candidatus Binatia bacterium]|nr:MAG: shikimate dehydrogenase [Candidatus Binatia bacterium]